MVHSYYTVLPPHILGSICHVQFRVKSLKIGFFAEKRATKKHSTCHATLLQNELYSDVASFTTNMKPVLQQIRLLTHLNVGGKTRNIAIQLAAMLQKKLHVFCCPFFRKRAVNFQSLSKLANADFTCACWIGEDTELCRSLTRSCVNLMIKA